MREHLGGAGVSGCDCCGDFTSVERKFSVQHRGRNSLLYVSCADDFYSIKTFAMAGKGT